MHDILQRTSHLAPDDLPLFSALLEDWISQHYPKLDQTAEPWQPREKFHNHLDHFGSAVQQALATAEWATHHGDPRPVTLNYDPVQHTLQVQLGDQIAQGAPGELPPTLAGHLFSPAGNAPVITLGLNSLRLLNGRNTEPLLYLLESAKKKARNYINSQSVRTQAIGELETGAKHFKDLGIMAAGITTAFLGILTPLVWGHPGPAYYALWVILALALGLLIQAKLLRRYTKQLEDHLSDPQSVPLPHLRWPLNWREIRQDQLTPPQPGLRDTLSLLNDPGVSPSTQTDPKISARLDTLAQARKDLLELRQQAAAHSLPELAEIDRLLAQVGRMSAEQVQPGEQQLQDDVRQRTAVMKSFLNDLEIG